MRKYRAKSGTALVLDPNSGAVLAMASLPTFDPNDFRGARPGARHIRAVADAYEPGSTFKVITAAAAIEHNLVDPLDVIDCEKGHIRLDRVRINDHKPFDELTFREVIAKSSNVGTIKIGLEVGAERLYEMIRGFGVGQRTGIDLPGESAGILRDVSAWNPRSIAYISFGQAVSTTPLQIANVFAAIANGGVRYRPFVVAERVEDGEVVRVEPEVLGASRFAGHGEDGRAHARARRERRDGEAGGDPRLPRRREDRYGPEGDRRGVLAGQVHRELRRLRSGA